MTIGVPCPCGKKLRVRATLAGRKIRCPVCQEVLVVPNRPSDGVMASVGTTIPRPSVPARTTGLSDDELLTRYQGETPHLTASDDPVGYTPSKRRRRRGATVLQKQITFIAILVFAVLVGTILGLVFADPAFVVIATVPIALLLLNMASLWLVFAKVGYPGWYSLVPVMNLVVIVVWGFVCRGLADCFDKGWLFVAGLFFLGGIFFPILGFGEAEATT